MYIPTDCLTSLKCTYCGSFLSVFPINVYPDTDTYTCGRCIVEDNLNPQRQVLFEKLTQNAKFPCRYKSDGCVKSGRPDELAQHEISCEQKPFFCLHLPLGSCAWQGKVDELYDHYSNDHKQYKLDQFKIEIDLIRKYEENYVFGDQSKPFIANLLCKPEQFEIVCFVSTWKHPEKYSYKLCFSNANKDKYECSVQQVQYHCENLENKGIFVDTEKINSKLNNPTYIICTIEIICKVDPLTESLLSKSEEEMLRTIECPVCMVYMVPPIMQCNTGHSICTNCKLKCTECPTCCGPIGETRNFSLEMFTSFIKYPCKYRDYDCRYVSTGTTIRTHETACKYGPFACPIDSCDWKYKHSLLMSHIMDEHVNEYLDLDKSHRINYLCDDEESTTYVTTCHGDIFKLCFEYAITEFYWALQLVGPAEDAKKYSFELELSNDNKERIVIVRSCGALSHVNEAFDEGKPYILLTKDTLMNILANDDELTYNFRIVLN